ncbi:MAG TPA: DUF732 domain-containing protein [Arthrobacter sp.]
MSTDLQTPALGNEPDLLPTPKKRKGPIAKTFIALSLLLGLAILACAVTVGVTVANGGPQALLTMAAGMPIPDSAREPAFNQAVKTGGGDYTAGKSESAVVAEARAFCTRLDSGESISDVITSSSKGVSDLQGFGTVMGTGIVMFCPSHAGEMKTYLASIGQGDKAP